MEFRRLLFRSFGSGASAGMFASNRSFNLRESSVKRRVVITGLGIVSPVGNSIENAWDNIVNGRSGIGRITRFDPSAFNAQIAGEVKDFDVTQYMSAKEAKQMDTFIH